jgi:hypothetical protein
MPVVTIQTPQGENIQIDAPDGATDDQIFRFAKSQGLFDAQSLTDEQRLIEGTQNPDVPTVENMAIESARADSIPEPTLLDQVIGAGEAALTSVSGATTGALGFGLGAIEGVGRQLTGELSSDQALEVAQDVASSMTYEPRTERGQKIIKGISSALGSLPPVIGATPVSTLRSVIPGRQITDSVISNPRSRKALLVEQIKSGNPDIDTVTKALDSSGKLITRPASVRALKVLGDDDAAKRTISLMENLNPRTKAQVRGMLSNIEKGNKNALFKNENRPSDILGQSILDRAQAVRSKNEQAGRNIGNLAKSLDKTNVDIGQVNNEFFNKLTDLGVTFNRGDDGWVTPDFSRSKFVGGSQKDMSVLVNDLLNGTPDFNTAHKLKQTIRDNVNFDKGGTGQLNRQSETILKDLSRGIDDILDSTSPKYKKANEIFAKTIKLKEDFDNLAGKDIDINSDIAAKALGSKGMRLVSNAESRVKIQQTLNNADKVLSDLGVKFKDDLPSLVHMTAELNNIFKLAPSGSLKGNVVSGGIEVAEALTSPIGAARTVSNKIEKMTTPDFNKKMRALRSLVSEGKK